MARYSVNVPSRIVAGLRRHAAATLPAECCGALIGLADSGRIAVRATVPLDNEERAVDRYRIDARVVLRLDRCATATGTELVGFYHSHPTGPAAPSTVDLELACPGYIYLIVQPRLGSIRAWRLREDRLGFRELPLRLTADAA